MDNTAGWGLVVEELAPLAASSCFTIIESQDNATSACISHDDVGVGSPDRSAHINTARALGVDSSTYVHQLSLRDKRRDKQPVAIIQRRHVRAALRQHALLHRLLEFDKQFFHLLFLSLVSGSGAILPVLLERRSLADKPCAPRRGKQQSVVVAV